MEPATEISAPFGQLDRRDREILAFERQWWKYAGAKEQAIRELFDMSATRYYQVLNALLDKPEAMAADPLLIKRLRRLRTSRQRTRAARRLGFQYEGLFRQHQIVKGENRDTAWYSILDGEWPARKAAFERWLAPENFDRDGGQKTRLGAT